MAKKLFINPFVMLSGIPDNPGGDIYEGDGTGQTGFAPFPMAYGEEWIDGFGDDWDGDLTESTPSDYKTWWDMQMEEGIAGFTVDAYNAMNNVTYPALPNP